MIDIKELLEQGEGITVEFKESKRELNKDTFESVCAMLNRLGGHLFLGVEDDGTVCGIDCIEKIKKNFVTQMNNPDKINPTFYAQLQEYNLDGKVILYVQIPANPAIAKFFREIGLADELGSGVKNVTKYLKIYSGGEPEFIEEDIFKQILPIKEQKMTEATTEEQKHHRNTTETPQKTPQKMVKIFLIKLYAFALNQKQEQKYRNT